MFLFIAGLIISYLIGSIPTSYIMGMGLRGIDLRKCGSGNLGATNALRILGWKIGVLVLIIDLLKGLVPVLVFARYSRVGDAGFLSAQDAGLFFGLAAITGHIFTVFMRFRGGKGVATSMGVFLGLAPIPFVITLAIAFMIIYVSRYVSLGSMAGAVILPILIYVFYPGRIALFMFATGVGVFVILRHRANIRRLIRGEENKIFT